MTSAEPALTPGALLDDHELVRRIGKGGFAEVWLARRKEGGRESRVAIKMILPKYGKEPQFRHMFMDEARLASLIEHPNVVRVLEFGEERDVLYLVMEQVVGRSLHLLNWIAKTKGRPIPPGVLMRILADTCAGLHAAHELTRDGVHLGVIHRDVSPQNILVDERGIAKLIDFGVAKATGRIAGDTSTGIAKGKIAYMAPEQAHGHALDRRVDVWGVGAIAYEVLEGHPPFDGPNDVARIGGLISDRPVPPMTARVPAELRAVIAKALMRDPSQRFASAAELRVAIEDALARASLRTTNRDVARHFGSYLRPPPDGDDLEAGDETDLRRRLAPKSGTDAEALRATGLDRDARTLAAVDSSAVPGAARRTGAKIWAGIVCGLVINLVVGCILVARQSDPPPRAPTVMAVTGRTSVVGVVSPVDSSALSGPRIPSAAPVTSTSKKTRTAP
jgi:serine/threonine protein kinase